MKILILFYLTKSKFLSSKLLLLFSQNLAFLILDENLWLLKIALLPIINNNLKNLRIIKNNNFNQISKLIYHFVLKYKYLDMKYKEIIKN